MLLLLSRPAVIERCPSCDPASLTGGVPGADGPSGVPSDALPRPSAKLPEGSEDSTAAVATALASTRPRFRLVPLSELYFINRRLTIPGRSSILLQPIF